MSSKTCHIVFLLAFNNKGQKTPMVVCRMVLNPSIGLILASFVLGKSERRLKRRMIGRGSDACLVRSSFVIIDRRALISWPKKSTLSAKNMVLCPRILLESFQSMFMRDDSRAWFQARFSSLSFQLVRKNICFLLWFSFLGIETREKKQQIFPWEIEEERKWRKRIIIRPKRVLSSVNSSCQCWSPSIWTFLAKPRRLQKLVIISRVHKMLFRRIHSEGTTLSRKSDQSLEIYFPSGWNILRSQTSSQSSTNKPNWRLRWFVGLFSLHF